MEPLESLNIIYFGFTFCVLAGVLKFNTWQNLLKYENIFNSIPGDCFILKNNTPLEIKQFGLNLRFKSSPGNQSVLIIKHTDSLQSNQTCFIIPCKFEYLVLNNGSIKLIIHDPELLYTDSIPIKIFEQFSEQ